MVARIRNIHLFLSLLTIPFVLIYGISTFHLLHPDWFTWAEPSEESREVLIPLEHRDPPRALAQYLMQEGYRGDLMTVKSSTTTVTLAISMPGSHHAVTYRRGTGSAKVQTKVETWLGLMSKLHRTGGVWHDHWALNFWSLVAFITSLSLVGLGVTGVLLWIPRNEGGFVGGLLLFGSTAITIALLWVCRG